MMKSSVLFQYERQAKMNRNFISKTSRTDWEYLDRMNDDEIDFSDNPEVGTEMFERGVVRKRLKPVLSSEKITIRLEKDVLSWLKSQENSYQQLINNLLRDQMNKQLNKTTLQTAYAH